MIRILTVAFAALTLGAPALAMTASEARQCNAMAESLAPKQAAIAERLATRDALAAQTEQLGEVFDLAQEQRNFSPEHAAVADEARAAWEASRNETLRIEGALQSDVRQLNTDVAQYNARCTSN